MAGNGEVSEKKHQPPFILSDRIFVKNNEKMIKIDIKDIRYIEADRNYCRIFCAKQRISVGYYLKRYG